MSGIRNTMQSSDVNNNDVNYDSESIDSDSSGSDTELRAIDTRRHGGQLVLVRNNAVAPRPRPQASWANRGRRSPGGTEYDNDGWPMDPPVVVATRVATPVVMAQPFMQVSVPETPPRSTRPPRAPVRNAPPRQVEQLMAAEERIAQLQDEVRLLKRNNRDMRSVRDTYITFGEELVIENDNLLEEIKKLRKRPRVEEVIPAPAPALPEEVIDLTEDDDEFPLENPEVYYPLPIELPEGETPGTTDNVNSI